MAHTPTPVYGIIGVCSLLAKAVGGLVKSTQGRDALLATDGESQLGDTTIQRKPVTSNGAWIKSPGQNVETLIMLNAASTIIPYATLRLIAGGLPGFSKEMLQENS